MNLKIDYVQGVEGNSLYLNDRRIAGNKPWGGGKIIKTWNLSSLDAENMLEVLEAALHSTRTPPVNAFKIGEYTLSDTPRDGLMIYHESGEGGQFKIDALAEVVDKFYKENF